MSVITKIETENVKRLKFVRYQPDGSTVLIGGKNAAGKTSLIDSIMYALGGTRGIPDQPLRQGEEKGRVYLELSNGMTIERKFKPGGKTSLIVKDANDVKLTSPQKILDALWSAIASDPLAYSRSKPKERVAVLRKVSGLDFTALDEERETSFEERKVVNRKIRDLEGKIREMPAHEDAPEEPVTATAIQEELRGAEAKHKEAEAAESEFEQLELRATETAAAIEVAMEEVVTARLRVKQLQKNLDTEKEQAGLAKAFSETASKDLPDRGAIASKMDEITAVNVKVSDNKAVILAKEEHRELTDQAEQLTGEIEDVDKEKKEQLDAANLPVPGLGFSAGDVTINDLPWDQASQAEQLRTSTAMALALKPGIRVLLIRDASLLDGNNLMMMAEMAEAADAQIWMEVVREGGVHILIEDGEAVESDAA